MHFVGRLPVPLVPRPISRIRPGGQCGWPMGSFVKGPKSQSLVLQLKIHSCFLGGCGVYGRYTARINHSVA